MGDLANCPRCIANFIAGTAAVCSQCRSKEEQGFQKVYAFMRKKHEWLQRKKFKLLREFLKDKLGNS
ncbi:hypothetical protein [Halobacillus sp. K22]|uniref:hypothetical protein n=1 Tax=Halobacillus sp. K22 TaxID=3457431 RepID=UPI003FCE6018